MELAEVAYDVTLEDLVAFNVFHLRNDVAMRRRMNQLRLMTLVASALLAGLELMHDSPIAAAIALAVGLATVWVLPWTFGRLMPSVVRRMLKKGGALLGPHRLVMEPAGLHGFSPIGDGYIPYGSVHAVVFHERHLFLYLSASAAATIPLAAFPSADAARAFAAALEQARDRARAHAASAA
jgi:hypothetical protein